jgi:hypothetical protein
VEKINQESSFPRAQPSLQATQLDKSNMQFSIFATLAIAAAVASANPVKRVDARVGVAVSSSYNSFYAELTTNMTLDP